MASLASDDKITFLLQILQATDGTPDLSKVANARGDKKANIQYQYKAIVKATSEFVLQANRVISTSDAPATGTAKAATPKTPRTKKSKKVETDCSENGIVEANESVPVVPPTPTIGSKRGRAKANIEVATSTEQPAKKQKHETQDDIKEDDTEMEIKEEETVNGDDEEI